MIKLSGKVIRIQSAGSAAIGPIKITKNPRLPAVLRSSLALLSSSKEFTPGFSHYLTFDEKNVWPFVDDISGTVLSSEFDYLDEGDIVSIIPDTQRIRVLFRAASPHNSFLVTERCNHYCLMCSQPPKEVDDTFLLDEIETALRMVPKDTKELGFTGGEPTLHNDRFLNLLRIAKSHLPETAIHVLSNGRKFSDEFFCRDYAKIEHPNLMVGIPIYSDDPALHDYIVQSAGAFDETIAGILNLKRYGQKVEIRVVLHKQSIATLISLCDFITRNLVFVDHVALMGLEMMGFTRANLEKLWIDPFDYKDQLSRAVNILKDYRVPVSVYNHQLCVVNQDIFSVYRRSISDWKNEYPDTCEPCKRKMECGGFFSSAMNTQYSTRIRPFLS